MTKRVTNDKLDKAAGFRIRGGTNRLLFLNEPLSIIRFRQDKFVDAASVAKSDNVILHDTYRDNAWKLSS